MSDHELIVQSRSETGKGIARKLRSAGRIPAVIYGLGKDPVPVAADPRAIDRLLRAAESGLNTIIDLKIEGGAGETGRKVMIREIQRDPARRTMIHADFLEIDLRATIEVDVPVHLVGKSHGVEMGGILDHTLREIKVECLPSEIPDGFEYDISHLDINDTVRVSDLQVPSGVTILVEMELGVAHVAPPTVEEEPSAELGDDAEEGTVVAGEEAKADGEGDSEGGDS